METSLLIGTGDFLAAGFGEACFTGLAEDAFFDVTFEADLDGFGEGEAFFVSIFFETALGAFRRGGAVCHTQVETHRRKGLKCALYSAKTLTLPSKP